MPFLACLRHACGLALLLISTLAQADRLEGRGADGRPFDLQQRRGRVVLVHYWSAACAPCRTLLPELRANLRGWQARPFDLVSVSLDAREADWREFERLQAVTQADVAQRGYSLWHGATRDGLLAQRPVQLPLTLVFDIAGREVARYSGRLPPHAWDEIAALLP